MKKIYALLILAAIFTFTLPIPAQEDTYEDPKGRYSFPIPTNWVVEEVGDYITASAPEEGILIHIFVETYDGDAESAVQAAWQVINPDFDLPITNTTTVDDPAQLGGLDLAVNIFYEAAPDRLVIGGATVLQDVNYILLLDADVVAFQERSSQVAIINTGFIASLLDDQDELSETEAQAVTDEMIAELEIFIENILELSEIPGLAIAIVQEDEIIYANGFGVKGLESTDPVTADTQMMIGSTTKAMTTMTMAALIDEGLMQWDTPVIELLPSFKVADPDITQTLTVRNLVCACSGVPRRDFELIFNIDTLTAEDIVQQLATFRFFTDFGEAFQYSNQMVAMGGYAAALAEGAQLGTLYEGYLNTMQTRLFDPIGMDNTTFREQDVFARGDYALPTGVNLDGEYYPLPISLDTGFGKAIAPAGAAWSTVDDMGKFMMTALNRGETEDGVRILSKGQFNELWEPQIPITADTEYGLGWFVEDYKGRAIFSHAGNMLGYTSEMAIVPTADLGIVVLTNIRGGNAINGGVRTRLLELIFEQEPEIEAALTAAFTNEEEDEINYGELDITFLEDYTGTWINPELGTIEIRIEEETLLMDAGEWISEIRPLLNDDGEFEDYVLYELPLTGIGVHFEDGQITLGIGVVEYIFISA